MSLKLKAATGGSVTLDLASTASNYNLTIPASTTTMVGTDTTQTLTNKTLTNPIIQNPSFVGFNPLSVGTAWNYSGTTTPTIDFTGIPTNTKRITILLSGVSLTASNGFLLQIGSGSLVTTGYTTLSAIMTTAPGISTSSTLTTGLVSATPGGAGSNGIVSGTITLYNISGNTWTAVSTIVGSTPLVVFTGYITLSGALDRLSLVCQSASFDAGTVNIMYE
jgi:hypothetical protein